MTLMFKLWMQEVIYTRLATNRYLTTVGVIPQYSFIKGEPMIGIILGNFIFGYCFGTLLYDYVAIKYTIYKLNKLVKDNGFVAYIKDESKGMNRICLMDDENKIYQPYSIINRLAIVTKFLKFCSKTTSSNVLKVFDSGYIKQGKKIIVSESDYEQDKATFQYLALPSDLLFVGIEFVLLSGLIAPPEETAKALLKLSIIGIAMLFTKRTQIFLFMNKGGHRAIGILIITMQSLIMVSKHDMTSMLIHRSILLILMILMPLLWFRRKG